MKASTGPGIQTVLHNGATPGIWPCAILLTARRSVGAAIAEDCQIMPDSTCSLNQQFPGIGSLAGPYLIFELVIAED